MTEAWGLQENDLKIIKSTLVSLLKSKTQYSVYTFGSRARENHRKYSDLDLLIESSPQLEVKELAELSSHFDDSDLTIKIDIVTPETCLEAFRHQINSEKKIWFKKL